MNNWEQKTLGEVLTLQRGFDLPQKKRVQGTVPIISSSGTSDHHNESRVEGPGVVTGRYGTIGQVFYTEEPFWPLNTTLWVKDFKGNHPKFIYYLLHTINYLEYSDKAAVPGINRNHVHQAEVHLPPLETQKAIAHILGTLDDKIELNRRMNETLEAMAQALFKSWFVDFDPVKAKMEGRQPEGMDAATAALFPDKLVESELGLIPEGWKCAPLKEFMAIKHGFAFKGKHFSKETTDDILLTPGNFKIGGGFKGQKFKYYSGPIPEDFILREGELLVSMTDLSKAADTLGYPAIVPNSPPLTFLHNQRLGRVSFKGKSVGRYYVYHQLCSSAYRDEILAGASGTTVKHTSPTKILAYRFPFSGGGVESLFEGKVASFMEKIQKNDIHSSTLAGIRESLLPKLISGEISTENLS